MGHARSAYPVGRNSFTRIRRPAIVTVSYRQAGAAVAENELVPLPNVQLDLTNNPSQSIVPGSVRFKYAGLTYVDRAGELYHSINTSTNVGTLAGIINYVTGQATLTDYGSGDAQFELVSAVVRWGQQLVTRVAFATPGAPVKNSSLSIQCEDVDGNTLTAVSNQTGDIIGTGIDGFIDYPIGVVSVRFGEDVVAAGNEAEPWYDAAEVDGSGNIFKPTLVVAGSIKFNANIVGFIPLDAELTGINSIRLPTDGRVPFMRKGDVIVAHYGETITLDNPAVAGTVIDTGQTRLANVEFKDSAGLEVDPALYVKNLDAGTVTLADPIDLTGYTQPLQLRWNIEDGVLLSDVQINGDLAVTKPFTHNFPIGTKVSSALLMGDLQARYTNLFDQQSWTGEFSEDLIGNSAIASFNDIAYPLEVTNQGTITEKWVLIFTSANNFKVVGETVGQVALGNTTTQTAPINASEGVPYFTINPNAFGAGWIPGNAIRFETVSANFPIWAVRTVLQSNPTVLDDDYEIQLRGNIDNEG